MWDSFIWLYYTVDSFILCEHMAHVIRIVFSYLYDYGFLSCLIQTKQSVLAVQMYWSVKLQRIIVQMRTYVQIWYNLLFPDLPWLKFSQKVGENVLGMRLTHKVGFICCCSSVKELKIICITTRAICLGMCSKMIVRFVDILLLKCCYPFSQ